MATFFWVESRIGILWALAIAISTAIVGSVMVQRAGLSVLRRIRSRWAAGNVPGRELSDGAAILVAGAFLISPGFITDTLGFLLLVPAVRALVYRSVTRRFSQRFTVVTAARRSYRTRPDPRPFGQVSDEEIIDVDFEEKD